MTTVRTVSTSAGRWWPRPRRLAVAIRHRCRATAGGLCLLLFSHPAVHVRTPVDDTATEAEAVRPNTEMPPVPERGHRGTKSGRHLLEGQKFRHPGGDVVVGHGQPPPGALAEPRPCLIRSPGSRRISSASPGRESADSRGATMAGTDQRGHIRRSPVPRRRPAGDAGRLTGGQLKVHRCARRRLAAVEPAQRRSGPERRSLGRLLTVLAASHNRLRPAAAGRGKGGPKAHPAGTRSALPATRCSRHPRPAWERSDGQLRPARSAARISFDRTEPDCSPSHRNGRIGRRATLWRRWRGALRQEPPAMVRRTSAS